MLTLIIAIVIGLVVGGLSHVAGGLGMGWSVFWGILTTLVAQLGMGLLIRRKVMKVNNQIEAVVQAGQQRVNRKIQQFNMKPAGSVKTMRKVIEKEQESFLREALAVIDALEPFCKWNLLLRKQVNTMRFQFHYQLKEFDKVDEHIGNALFFDHLSVAMKMARQYHHGDPKLDKFFRRKIRKYKNEEGALLYGLYSWILVKRGDVDAAIKILVEGKEVTDDETLKKNWEHLVNGKVKRFSNAGLGDEWYALHLEEPKIKQKRVKRVYR